LKNNLLLREEQFEKYQYIEKNVYTKAELKNILQDQNNTIQDFVNESQENLKNSLKNLINFKVDLSWIKPILESKASKEEIYELARRFKAVDQIKLLDDKITKLNEALKLGLDEKAERSALKYYVKVHDFEDFQRQGSSIKHKEDTLKSPEQKARTLNLSLQPPKRMNKKFKQISLQLQ